MSDALILRRTRRLVRSWPAATQAVAAGYFRTRPLRRARSEAPYWLLLPRWLNARLCVHTREALDDILWAQYCLFAFVRLQDDVVDGQATSARLVFVANEFLVESERTFWRHVPDASFWTLFRASLAETSRGILETAAMQRRPRAGHEPLLACAARVAAVFRVGSAAVCLPAGARADFARVVRFVHHASIAGQLVDDFEDVAEDLADGRLNAAARLIARGDRVSPRSTPAVMPWTLPLRKNVESVVALVRSHTGQALAAIEPLQIADVRRYARRTRAELQALERTLRAGGRRPALRAFL